jgi:hypothetical protein
MMANNDLMAIIFPPLFLAAGLMIHLLPGFRNPYARRAFVLTFCTCVMVMGMVQIYAKVFFGDVQTTTDAIYFYDSTYRGRETETLTSLKREIIAPLPIFIWRTLYTAVPSGPWLGILLNSFIVGMAGSITIKAGSYLLGNDPYRLYRLGTLFSCCGIFWLFGSLFLRDSFALLFNVIFIWACLRALTFPSLINFFTSAAAIFFSSFLMEYVREGFLPMSILIILLALFSFTRRKKFGILMFLLPALALIIGLILLPLISSYASEVGLKVNVISTRYGGDEYVMQKSLGASIIVNQPKVIRLPLGSIYLLVQPIPLWVDFHFYFSEYHWIKGYQGIYLVYITPMAFVGLAIAIKRAFSGGVAAPPACFVAIYVILTTMAVAATSLETRHHGQFLPAFLMLAALPDNTDPLIRRKIKSTMMGWFALVVAGHIMWIALKLS